MRRLKIRTVSATFRFARPATTSRGTLLEKRVPYIFLSEEGDPQVFGVGECSLFPGLSADDRPGFDRRLADLQRSIGKGADPRHEDLSDWPSIAFGWETALADLEGGGRRLLFPSAFTEGRAAVPINGLVWMGSKEDMLAQVKRKLDDGFRCLKLKIGALGGPSGEPAGEPGLGFDEEFSILSGLRREFGEDELELRVDANGAFSPEEAPGVLDRLASLRIHSIEQPIRAGQREAMARLCATTPLPIALDEELIGVASTAERKALLDEIRPHFLIVKPGLLGGLCSCDEWIGLAAERGIGYWVTSALETAVGLNAIAQWAYTKGNPLRQGLSTGKIFDTSIPSPLSLRGEELWHLPEADWNLRAIENGGDVVGLGRD